MLSTNTLFSLCQRLIGNERRSTCRTTLQQLSSHIIDGQALKTAGDNKRSSKTSDVIYSHAAYGQSTTPSFTLNVEKKYIDSSLLLEILWEGEEEEPLNIWFLLKYAVQDRLRSNSIRENPVRPFHSQKHQELYYNPSWYNFIHPYHLAYLFLLSTIVF